ncbi:hypothetical protein DFAR_2870028 [Desulfarculales bacterium]
MPPKPDAPTPIRSGYASFPGVVLTKLIRKQVLEVAQDRKKQPVLIIDAASLLRLQVPAELHTITQFQGDFKPILPITWLARATLPISSYTKPPCP